MSTAVTTESSASSHSLPAAAAAKKPRNNSRKPLKQKKDSNIIMPEDAATLSSSKQTKKASSGFETVMQEMQEMMEKMKIEKEKAEEKLKDKEEELETKGKEHEKLQIEIKKLQKLKEFKPTVSFPVVQINADKEQGKMKKKKKKGGPERKRPSPPYILWCKDQWNEVKKDNPNAEFKEIGNILGAKWKTFGAEEKRPYEEKYKTEKVAYLEVANKEKRESEAMKLLEEEQKQKTAMELLEQYLQFKQEADSKKGGKKEKDPLKPKQPMSAFLLFSNESRAAHLGESKSVVEVAKIAGEEWRKMTEKQKAPYKEIAKKNKEIYLQEMEAYKQMKEEEAVNMMKEEDELMKLQKQEAMQLLKKKERTKNIIKKSKETRQKKKKVQDAADPNKPKKPASSFILFSKEARKALAQERPGVNNSTLNALISVKWKELGEEERQVWNGMASEAMEAYKKELLVYNQKLAEEGGDAKQH